MELLAYSGMMRRARILGQSVIRKETLYAAFPVLWCCASPFFRSQLFRTTNRNHAVRRRQRLFLSGHAITKPGAARVQWRLCHQRSSLAIARVRFQFVQRRFHTAADVSEFGNPAETRARAAVGLPRQRARRALHFFNLHLSAWTATQLPQVEKSDVFRAARTRPAARENPDQPQPAGHHAGEGPPGREAVGV